MRIYFIIFYFFSVKYVSYAYLTYSGILYWADRVLWVDCTWTYAMHSANSLVYTDGVNTDWSRTLVTPIGQHNVVIFSSSSSCYRCNNGVDVRSMSFVTQPTPCVRWRCCSSAAAAAVFRLTCLSHQRGKLPHRHFTERERERERERRRVPAGAVLCVRRHHRS